MLDKVERGDSMSRKIERRSKFYLLLLGIFLAFVVQVLYDILGGSFYTQFMPKTAWGILIISILAIVLVSIRAYMERLSRQEGKK